MADTLTAGVAVREHEHEIQSTAKCYKIFSLLIESVAETMGLGQEARKGPRRIMLNDSAPAESFFIGD